MSCIDSCMLLASSTQTKHPIQDRLLLNGMVRKSEAFFQLLSSKESRRCRSGRNASFVDLSLDYLNSNQVYCTDRGSLSTTQSHTHLLWIFNRNGESSKWQTVPSAGALSTTHTICESSKNKGVSLTPLISLPENTNFHEILQKRLPHTC